MKEEKKTILPQSTANVLRVLFNLDTQSAITAALFVSLLTVAGSFFINLCNYVYWHAYFTRFRIPMAYFDEAIIPERGYVYTVIMCVPLALLLWWGLRQLTALADQWLTAKSVTAEKRRRRQSWLTFWCFVALLAVLMLVIFLLEIVPEGGWYLLTAMLLLEVGLSIFQLVFRIAIGYQYKISQKSYLVIRILAVIFLLYAILGGVYFAGQQDNYGGNYGQSLKIVNEPQINAFAMENGEETTVDLVLLETSDYYYVTQATLRKTDGALYMQVWDDDTARFIGKIDRPVKSIYAQLWYIDSNNHTTLDTLYLPYLLVCIVGGIVFMGLFSLPKKENDRESAEQ